MAIKEDALFNQICAWDALLSAYQRAAQGKRRKEAVARFEWQLEDELTTLSQELRERVYRPGEYEYFYIHEPKRRLIAAAPFRDRVVHHALCAAITPHLEKWFSPYSFANRPGMGTHRAIDAAQRHARAHQYVMHCDVRRYFQSIDHAILTRILRKMLPYSEGIMWLIDLILRSAAAVKDQAEDGCQEWYSGDNLFSALRPRGLPIGNLTSQWWANAYLTPIDEFIQRELGCKAYTRYVDDFVLFADSPKALWSMRQRLIDRLGAFRLSLHEERAQPRPVQDGFSFLGFIVFPTHRRLIPRKGHLFQRKLKRMIQTRPTRGVREALSGWIGHVGHGDTWGLRQAILRECGLLYE